MKRIKKLMLVVLVLGMLLSLTGCKDQLSDFFYSLSGSMKVDKLAEKYTEVNGQRLLTEHTITIPVSGSVTMDDENVDFTLKLEAVTKKENDNKQFGVLRIEGEFDDLWLSQRIDTYNVVEDNECVTYTHDRLSDVWQRAATGLTVEEMETFNTKLMEALTRCAEKYPYDLTRAVLAEEKQIVCNREVYVVEYSVSGQELQDMWSELDLVPLYKDLYSVAIDDIEADPEMEALEKKIMDAIMDSVMMDFGLQNLSAKYIMYIDAKTFDLVQETYEVMGVDAVADAFMDGFMTVIFDIMDEMGVEYDKEKVPEISIALDDITIVCSGLGFEPVTVPEVPERGLIITAQESFNPDMGDGTYVIQEYGDAVRISVPEGWLPEVNGYYGLTLTKQDANQMAIWGATESAVFTMYGEEEYTEEDLKASIAEYEAYFQSLGIYHETTCPTVDGYTVYRLNNMRLNAYYAWKPVGDGWLFIEYYDVTVQPMENTFLPMLAQISDYQL